jgi:hypothetical protein
MSGIEQRGLSSNARPRDKYEDRTRSRRALHYTKQCRLHTMADFGPAGPLRIEEAMSANTRFPGLQGLVLNGLMTNRPSSYGQHSTPSSPIRRNGSLDPLRVEPGAYECNCSSSLTLPILKEQVTRTYYLVPFHRRHKVRLDPPKRSTLLT